MKFGIRKLESCGYQMVKKLRFLRFGTISARDGRTDGHVAVAKTRASIASRGYKRYKSKETPEQEARLSLG